ncbi:TetR/AcrR family transcriptional regulator [Nocardia sp. NPDC101769]|uniref:TetR/AcrR family transcriptional regulator n=1 Tax=Nocardia sp. NPDC101769 TaxID=3364333 RepID=UPI003806EC4D
MAGTSKGAQTSSRLVETMLELIQAHGYAGTGLNTVVERAGAPKGSLYFHFPEGKEQLGERAVEQAAEQYRVLLADAALRAATPGALVREVVEALAQLTLDSDFRLGCPVSVVTLEVGAHSERLRTACATAFDSWIGPVTEYLIAAGHPKASAHTLATAAVSAVEGAVIVARAKRDIEPLHSTAQALATLLDASIPES